MISIVYVHTNHQRPHHLHTHLQAPRHVLTHPKIPPQSPYTPPGGSPNPTLEYDSDNSVLFEERLEVENDVEHVETVDVEENFARKSF